MVKPCFGMTGQKNRFNWEETQNREDEIQVIKILEISMPLLEEISEIQGVESDNCMATAISEEDIAII